MANLGFNLDTDESVKEYKAGFEVIPPGIYSVVIVESDLKDTSSGGKMMVFKYELQDGTKRHVVDRLNVVNISEMAQKIGRSALGKIAQVIGHKGILTNTDILHGRPFMVKIVIEEFESNTEKGKMLKSNKVTEYLAKGEATAAKAAASSNSAW